MKPSKKPTPMPKTARPDAQQDDLMRLRQLMQFHIDCGCDEVLASAPLQRLTNTPAASAAGHDESRPAPVRVQPAAVSKDSPSLTQSVPSVASQIAEAEALAQSATTLDALHRALEAFDALPIKAQAHNTVFCDGHPQADIMLIGEAPGRDEDLQGKPFVGQSGQLLDRIFEALGLARAEHIYIANCLPWRPPGNRTPTKDELAIMAPFVRRHIVLKAPRWLVCVGGVATSVLIDAHQTLGRLRGRWHVYTDGTFQCPAFVTYHPAWLLRRPDQKKTVWQDWLCFWIRVQETRDSQALPNK